MDAADATVLITGSTDGLGKVVARRLAEAGARVLLHGRSREKGERVLAELRAATGNRRLEYYQADFASLDQVRALATAVAGGHERLDVLINNAGVGFGRDRGRREVSGDGYELRFAVNHLAGYLLTALLLPTLIRSGPARIVNVASAGQHAIDFSDVMLEHGYEGTRAYRQSKLAQVMTTFGLAEELKDAGVTVNCLHPGTYMDTRMVTEAGIAPLSSVEDGASAVIHLATAPELAGCTGLYFDRMRPARAHAQAYDRQARRRLRALSDELTKLPVTG
ncbi:MAG: SDR family NAD(P)-dependent oxidoreductase [Rhodospirillaceae bacterium]|nr:SDR family NAD(P)-dependent oxidoreductase [Rhodospirillaceae bacterium]